MKRKLQQEKKIILFGLKSNIDLYDSIDINLKKDFEFVKLAVSLNLRIYQKIEKEFKKNVEIIEIALKNYQNISYVPPEYFYQNQKKTFELIKTYPYTCSYFPKELEEDFDFLKQLQPEKYWSYLTSNAFKTLLKMNEEGVIEKIKENSNLFRVCKPLHEYPKILELAIKINPNVVTSLEKISKEKLLEYLERNPEIIKKLHHKVKDHYKNDEDFKIYQIREDPTIFKEISSGITDREVLKKYLRISGICMNWILDPNIKKDKEMVLIAVNSAGDSLEFVDPSFYSDKDVIFAACENYGRSLSFASDELKDDFEVVRAAVRNNGTSIKFASKRLKLNVDLCLIALEQTRSAYRDLDITMKTQIDIWMVYTKRYQKLQPNKQESLRDIHFNFVIE